MLFGIFGVSWAVYDLLACWRGWIGRYGVGGIWQSAPCVSYSVFGESLMLVALREWSQVRGNSSIIC